MFQEEASGRGFCRRGSLAQGQEGNNQGGRDSKLPVSENPIRCPWQATGLETKGDPLSHSNPRVALATIQLSLLKSVGLMKVQ
ncbi:hypothetical protein CVT25_013575 [Psilocybe cyanescens]|uniref:Uncharacterized protein n=1 Tax=Psilocybe cyanescens TaxID=93625 RepID=A0A409XST1_PSICY|nr:hypothetical protein CVT25_013575 [Psilocybe cyanescens]